MKIFFFLSISMWVFAYPTRPAVCWVLGEHNHQMAFPFHTFSLQLDLSHQSRASPGFFGVGYWADDPIRWREVHENEMNPNPKCKMVRRWLGKFINKGLDERLEGKVLQLYSTLSLSLKRIEIKERTIKQNTSITVPLTHHHSHISLPISPSHMSHSGNEPRRHLKLSSSPTVAQIRSSQTLKDSHSSPSSDSNRRRLQEKNSLIPRGPFTVIVSGREFNLSYEQINYDQPNVFTIAFLDQGFNEQTNGTMIFDSRSSEIFQQIVEYLSGYPIFPVSQPRKLLADCEFYGLDGLRDLLSLPKVGDALSSRHAIRRVIRFEDVVSGRAKGVEWSEEGLVETERHALWHAMVFMTGALLKSVQSH